MATLLNIQSSPRGIGSLSRILSQDFVTEWEKNHDDGQVVLRDLAEIHLPFVGVPWIGGIFVPPEQRSAEQQHALKISDELIAELFAADHILIGTPMYNFTVPANLKAWIDLIVRPRATHSGPPERKGLVTGKRCTIIIASGGIYDEGLPAAGSDYESGYLKRILSFIGISDVDVVMAGGTVAATMGSATMEGSDSLSVMSAVQPRKERSFPPRSPLNEVARPLKSFILQQQLRQFHIRVGGFTKSEPEPINVAFLSRSLSYPLVTTTPGQSRGRRKFLILIDRLSKHDKQCERFTTFNVISQRHGM
ncbi:acyl carrier protein phosphodiesterase [Terriglobus roseus DSM 18391]|uniref:FMN dependent NADH:quinone oxidoreductase n=1 Tax=Terriglobus roseus (strain DSM 18391 / NRRL B-41598 / KBS 63) TaxID=926566 RepID=I3ZJ01_TERRK|nr:NAD(P)H-dependent oxidoreductase [Terriglobus roseus]AFL89219.1 acyl carrier protein phosphodiesterase [Terriglobus roseus DSM 18391]